MRRALVPSEWDEQVAVVQWCDSHPIAKNIFAVTNGARVDIGQAVKLKKAGVRKGYPDLALDVARGSYHGLRVELKRRKGGVVSAEQNEWVQRLTKEGYRAVICRGADEAIQAIRDYLALGVKR